MNPAQSATALLQLVADNLTTRREALRARAQGEARALLGQAHADARKRVRAALEEARKRGEERIARAKAQRKTRERLARQHRVKGLLEQGWARLNETLLQSWRDPSQRWQWVERSALRATSVVPGGSWMIAHPRDWPVQERERLRALLEAQGASLAGFAADDAVAAGVRMTSGYGVFDATLGGLLADRAAIEARLLFHLEKEEG
ncbi:MAG: hypothetical protein HYY78_23330 [Betaproteobacteria bacterium]|nr:hypothetical protein [Betaproteobacteria bacterium]